MKSVSVFIYLCNVRMKLWNTNIFRLFLKIVFACRGAYYCEIRAFSSFLLLFFFANEEADYYYVWIMFNEDLLF